LPVERAAERDTVGEPQAGPVQKRVTVARPVGGILLTSRTDASRRPSTGQAVGDNPSPRVWRFRSPQDQLSRAALRIAEQKPHSIKELLVSFDFEVRIGGRREFVRTSNRRRARRPGAGALGNVYDG
jgi:hypothetical protein